MPVSMVNAVISPGHEHTMNPGGGGKSLEGGAKSLCESGMGTGGSPPSLGTMLRSPQHLNDRNFPKVGDRFKGAKLYQSGAGGHHKAREQHPHRGSPSMAGVGSGVELPDIREVMGGKFREPPRVVKEAALEAEDVARQLREAGLVAEAAALERLRHDLMAPGADLSAKKVEARMLAEKLRAQAKEKAHSRRYARQAHGSPNQRGSPITITGRTAY